MADEQQWIGEWQLSRDDVACAVAQVTPMIALPMRSLVEAVGPEPTVVGTLMGCAVLALDGGCDRGTFLRLCAETWDLMDAAGELSTSIGGDA